MDSVTTEPDHLRVKLEEGAQQLSLALIDQHYASLLQFIRLLNKWNRVYNLTAVRNIDDMVGRHILDSLSVLQYLPNESSKLTDAVDIVDVLDVGTGAGLPVLPLSDCASGLNVFISGI